MVVNLIDKGVFGELVSAMGPDFVRELIASFAEDVPDLVATMRYAAQEGDAQGFRLAAFSIRSRSRVFGANVLAHLAQDIELAGLVDPDAYLPELESSFSLTLDALRQLTQN